MIAVSYCIDCGAGMRLRPGGREELGCGLMLFEKAFILET